MGKIPLTNLTMENSRNHSETRVVLGILSFTKMSIEKERKNQHISRFHGNFTSVHHGFPACSFTSTNLRHLGGLSGLGDLKADGSLSMKGGIPNSWLAYFMENHGKSY